MDEKLVELLEDALVALENSKPVMEHYVEPNIRHVKATEKVRAALAEAIQK